MAQGIKGSDAKENTSSIASQNSGSSAEGSFSSSVFSDNESEASTENSRASQNSESKKTTNNIDKNNNSVKNIRSKTEKSTAASSAKQTAGKTSAKQQSTAKPAVGTTAKQNSTTAAVTKPQNVTVSFCINCKNALSYGADVPSGGYLVADTQCTVKEGATAFDVLEEMCQKNGLELRYQSKTYIQSIGGLAEKDCGPASGWMYKVNGKNPNKPATRCELKNGDKIEWYYVTSSTDR